MRNYKNIDKYISELSIDVYAQPSDEGHLQMATDVFNKWVRDLGVLNLLDIGCGADAFLQPLVYSAKILYGGISLGNDVVTAQNFEKRILDMDMSFLTYNDDVFDLVWARHVLEHSPMPLLTLMEWHRVSNHYLCLIMPNPAHFTFVGRNHYSVMDVQQAAWLLRRAGWEIVKYESVEQELRFLCEKRERISYEGYVEAPLSGKVHDYERDTYK